MSGDSNVPSTNNGPPKQQRGTPLPFLDHDFKSYHNTGWYQWELSIQLKVTGTTQLNSVAFLVKLFATHGKENVNVFCENCRCLEVENFPDTAKN
eukprot:12210097-Ditylum_brightwellii.AAC.1